MLFTTKRHKITLQCPSCPSIRDGGFEINIEIEREGVYRATYNFLPFLAKKTLSVGGQDQSLFSDVFLHGKRALVFSISHCYYPM